MARKYPPVRKFVIEFRFPQGDVLYAGPYKGGLGWAPQIETAFIYETADKAGRFAANGYGSMFEYAHIMEVFDDGHLREVDDE